MLKNSLVLAVVALGLGACTVNRHHYAEPSQPEYAYDDRQEHDGPPGAWDRDAYDEPPGGYADEPYDARPEASDPFDEPTDYGAEPPRHRFDADRSCDCCCCESHSRRLAPEHYGARPVVPVVPQDPADWLE